jgi:hypothetical protein
MVQKLKQQANNLAAIYSAVNSSLPVVKYIKAIAI